MSDQPQRIMHNPGASSIPIEEADFSRPPPPLVPAPPGPVYLICAPQNFQQNPMMQMPMAMPGPQGQGQWQLPYFNTFMTMGWPRPVPQNIQFPALTEQEVLPRACITEVEENHHTASENDNPTTGHDLPLKETSKSGSKEEDVEQNKQQDGNLKRSVSKSNPTRVATTSESSEDEGVRVGRWMDGDSSDFESKKKSQKKEQKKKIEQKPNNRKQNKQQHGNPKRSVSKSNPTRVATTSESSEDEGARVGRWIDGDSSDFETKKKSQKKVQKKRKEQNPINKKQNKQQHGNPKRNMSKSSPTRVATTSESSEDEGVRVGRWIDGDSSDFETRKNPQKKGQKKKRQQKPNNRKSTFSDSEDDVPKVVTQRKKSLSLKKAAPKRKGMPEPSTSKKGEAGVPARKKQRKPQQESRARSQQVPAVQSEATLATGARSNQFPAVQPEAEEILVISDNDDIHNTVEVPAKKLQCTNCPWYILDNTLEEDFCTICFEKYEEPTWVGTLHPCHCHRYCSVCAYSAYHGDGNCPRCRVPIERVTTQPYSVDMLHPGFTSL